MQHIVSITMYDTGKGDYYIIEGSKEGVLIDLTGEISVQIRDSIFNPKLRYIPSLGFSMDQDDANEFLYYAKNGDRKEADKLLEKYLL